MILECLDRFLAKLLPADDCGNHHTTLTSDRGTILEKFDNLTKDFGSAALDECRIAIILDDNMYYASMRYEVYRLALKCEKTLNIE